MRRCIQLDRGGVGKLLKDYWGEKVVFRLDRCRQALNRPRQLSLSLEGEDDLLCLERSVARVKRGKEVVPLHQGFIKLMVRW